MCSLFKLEAFIGVVRAVIMRGENGEDKRLSAAESGTQHEREFILFTYPLFGELMG